MIFSITRTVLRSDMVLISHCTRQLVGHCQTNSSKREPNRSVTIDKESKVCTHCRGCHPKRLERRSFGCGSGISLKVLLRDMGYTGKWRKSLLRKIGRVAKEASRAIWSNMKEWGNEVSLQIWMCCWQGFKLKCHLYSPNFYSLDLWGWLRFSSTGIDVKPTEVQLKSGGK